ncbi:DUF2811 domain-containing protein [Cyanobium sp. LEGE 06113]
MTLRTTYGLLGDDRRAEAAMTNADGRDGSVDASAPEPSPTVSLQACVPEGLLRSMRLFIERHPHWDQYRLVQAALAGFLVQNGEPSRELTRTYLATLFPTQAEFRGR